MKNRIALAVDNITEKSEIEALVAATQEYVGVYKIGFEQFIRFGPSILSVIKDAGAQIFLDMKLHDIPNTVAKAVHSAAQLGVDYLTVHAAGGRAMLTAAARAAAQEPTAPKLLAVTVLTSIDEKALRAELNVSATVEEQVIHLATLAQDCGIDGIVCSAADLSAVKPHLKKGFEVVTPGIRPAGVSADDQKRVATPAGAITAGATLLVIGRAITQANNPGEAARGIVESL
ncbi:MAG: orotidine-5'-phosphate decarboxylase [Fibrobacterota bacterium]